MAMKTALIRGKAFWTKILGEPVDVYHKKGQPPTGEKEWTFDLSLDEAGIKQLTAEGLGSKIKNKGDLRGSFVVAKRDARKKKGPKAGQINQPIRVVDHHGNAWNTRTLIGNGSTVNVKYSVFHGSQGGVRFIPLALQVWDLVEYIPPEGGTPRNDFPVKEDGAVNEMVSEGAPAPAATW